MFEWQRNEPIQDEPIVIDNDDDNDDDNPGDGVTMNQAEEDGTAHAGTACHDPGASDDQVNVNDPNDQEDESDSSYVYTTSSDSSDNLEYTDSDEENNDDKSNAGHSENNDGNRATANQGATTTASDQGANITPTDQGATTTITRNLRANRERSNSHRLDHQMDESSNSKSYNTQFQMLQHAASSIDKDPGKMYNYIFAHIMTQMTATAGIKKTRKESSGCTF